MDVRTTSLNCQKCGGALACIDNHNAYRCKYCCQLASVERAAGGREPVTMHLPVDTSEFSSASPAEEFAERHPIALLADFLF